MPGFGSLAPFGLLEFGNVPSLAEPIYASMIRGVTSGMSTQQGDHIEATTYADAIAFASARATFKNGFNQRRPKRAVEFLPAHERTYGIVPAASESDEQRRRVVQSRKLMSRGSRREFIENALRTLLGSLFVAVVAETGTPATHPALPANEGSWDAPNTLPLYCKLLSPIAVVGASQVTFTYENLLGDGARITPLTRLTFEPENVSRTESVLITAASTTGALTARATFAKSHDIGGMIRSHAPVWRSPQRVLLVVLTAVAVTDPLVIRRTDALMKRLVRGSTQWAIAVESSPGNLGPYTIGLSRIGVTTVGPIVL